VYITGDEPTLHSDLSSLFSKLREIGFLVKIDTNGTNPMMVKGLHVLKGKKTLDPDFNKLKPFMGEQMRKFLAAAQKFLVNNKGKINLCLSETCFGVNDDWT